MQKNLSKLNYDADHESHRAYGHDVKCRHQESAAEVAGIETVLVERLAVVGLPPEQTPRMVTRVSNLNRLPGRIVSNPLQA